MIFLKVRNDISVATLTRISLAIDQHFQARDLEPIIDIIVFGEMDLRIGIRPEPPRETWEELLDLDIENMPRNALKLIEEDL